jgi:hypothetical protein
MEYALRAYEMSKVMIAEELGFQTYNHGRASLLRRQYGTT